MTTSRGPLGVGLPSVVPGHGIVFGPSEARLVVWYRVEVSPFRPPMISFQIQEEGSGRPKWMMEWVLAENGMDASWSVSRIEKSILEELRTIEGPRPDAAELRALVTESARFALAAYVRTLSRSWPDLLSPSDLMDAGADLFVEEVMSS